MDIFTVEEMNLICIFNTTNRQTLHHELVEALRGIDEAELIAIFVSSIEKLEKLTDEDFKQMNFYMADDEEEDA